MTLPPLTKLRIIPLAIFCSLPDFAADFEVSPSGKETVTIHVADGV